MHGIHHLRCSGSRTLQLGRARAPYESFQVLWALQTALEHGFIRLQPQEVVGRECVFSYSNTNSGLTKRKTRGGVPGWRRQSHAYAVDAPPTPHACAAMP